MASAVPSTVSKETRKAQRSSQIPYGHFLTLLTKRLRDNRTVLTELPQDLLISLSDCEKEG